MRRAKSWPKLIFAAANYEAFLSPPREPSSVLKITFGTASRADLQLPVQVNSTSLLSSYHHWK